jgi:glycosyltransferase involved in cell wall biosynthesis
VRALAAYRRLYRQDARLVLVGGPEEGEYYCALRSYIESLGLGGAVTLAGPVDDKELAEHYGQADVFVCLSEHEGFCIPLLEAMSHGIPVVTIESSAIPETVAGAALLLPCPGGRQPSALTVAAAAHRVLVDERLRAALVSAGRERVSDLSLERTRLKLGSALDAVTDGKMTGVQHAAGS